MAARLDSRAVEALLGNVVDLVRDYGVWGVFLLMLAENLFPPIPSEVIMLNAGVLVWLGDASFVAMVVAGVLGSLIGAWFWWAVGRYAGREFVVRHGRRLRITDRDLDRVDRWFARYGSAAVFFGRMAPLLRTLISLPAGIARMPIGRFTLYTTLGTIPWIAMLTWLGYYLAARFGGGIADQQHTVERVMDLAQYVVVAAITLLLVWFAYSRRSSSTAR